MSMKEKEQHIQPRVVFISTAIGVLLFVAAFFGLEAYLPSQDVVGSDGQGYVKNYGYVASGAKSSSPAFTMKGAPDDAMLLFGSSELSTPASIIPEVPAMVFGFGNYGVNLAYVGEAYDQSLWQSIAVGAYAERTKNKKIAIIVSPGWFEDGGLDNETFKLRFSYNLYRQFCKNPQISQANKEYVAKRLAEQGIDDTAINAGLGSTPVDWVNDFVLGAMNDLQIRKDLKDIRPLGIEEADVDGDINAETYPFAELREEALGEAEAASTNNDWGREDSYYTENVADNYDRLKGLRADQTFSRTPEYADFSHLLQICKEAGLEPLVIISPLHGPFNDHVGISQETRQQCYDHIKAICENEGVQVADFTDREYEKYFLFDTVHFGWTGWVDVEEAIYDFVNQAQE